MVDDETGGSQAVDRVGMERDVYAMGAAEFEREDLVVQRLYSSLKSMLTKKELYRAT